MPIGWGTINPCNVALMLPIANKLSQNIPYFACSEESDSPPSAVRGRYNGIASWFGWMLTALAISYGAQFWFDVIEKIIRLRSPGNKPK
ncbi:hypothetical protein CCP2SC5_160017 [Azospirillaceae bacterium]